MNMEFFSDPTWWGLVSCALIAAIIPAFFQKIRFSVLVVTALFSLTMIVTMYFLTGMVAAITGSVITLFAGFAFLFLSLVYSGIGNMLKKRYR